VLSRLSASASANAPRRPPQTITCCQDLLDDASNDLRRCAVTARSQQGFEPLLSPQFAARVSRLRKLHEDLFFETSG
jgi:hypothetical protein